MRSPAVAAAAVCLLLFGSSVHAQISTTPFIESFDADDRIPSDWTLSGFEVSASGPRSSPHCLLARGNTLRQVVSLPPFDPDSLPVRELRWFERRSGSALPFRLTITYRSGIDAVLLAVPGPPDTENSYRERRVLIPPLPHSSLHEGWFEMAVEADSTNSTGVIRIDDVSYDVETRFDASLSIHIPDAGVRFVGEEIPVRLQIVNETAHATDVAGLALSWTDASRSAERKHLLNIPSIPGHDTTHILWYLQPESFGSVTLTGRYLWPEDENGANDTATVGLTVGYRPGSLLVSEFMFAPVREDEPEWVEIYNPGPDIVDLSHVTISDRASQRADVSVVPILVVPAQYSLLATSASIGDLYDLGKTSVAVVRLPALNNATPDAVVLRDRFGTVLDSVAYDPVWGRPGTSLERRDWDLSSTDRTTWSPSSAVSGGTPGRSNSAFRQSVDCGIESFSVETGPANDIRFRVVVRNAGRNQTPEGVLVFTVIPGFGPDETLFPDPIPVSSLPSGQLIELASRWEPPASGTYNLRARVEIAGDSEARNDTASTEISIPYGAGDLLVNEIMFDPWPGESEWIELRNMTGHPISLLGWSLLDLPTASGARTRVVCDSPVRVAPYGLAVVMGDSSGFNRFPWLRTVPYREHVFVANRSGGLGLNGSEDGIVVTDPLGTSVDSILYSERWHNPSVVTRGRSLERMRTDLSGTIARAWTSSPGHSGGTPGQPNRSLPPAGAVPMGFSIDPNPFSPDGDGIDDLVYLRFSYTVPSVFVRARIFDDMGREIRLLANGSFFAGSDLLVWDGHDERGRKVRRGVYILFLESWNSAEHFSTVEKRAIVVAR